MSPDTIQLRGDIGLHLHIHHLSSSVLRHSIHPQHESQELLLCPSVFDLAALFRHQVESDFPTALEPRAEQPAAKVVTGTADRIFTAVYHQVKRFHDA
jgi:hypothetical protein